MSRPKGQLAKPIFAKIAPHEYLVANLARETTADSSPFGSGTRPNGRSPEEARAFDVHTGSLSQAHGSAAVRLDRTRVICGVRAEILPVDNIPHYRPSAVTTAPTEAGSVFSQAEIDTDNRRQLRDYDLLVPNLELATGSAPEFLPGGPPSVLAQPLSTRLYSLLHASGLVDAERLKIWHQPPSSRSTDSKSGDDEMDVDESDADEALDAFDPGQATQGPELKAYWTLYIDLLFLSFDGNPFDAAWAAVVAALRDTQLPLARWDADRGEVVCSPQTETESEPETNVASSAPLTLRGLPVATTAVVCVENKKKRQQGGARWILLDPDRLEENQCRETVTVVVDRSDGSQTMVRALSKTGGVLVGPRELHALVAAAEKRWTALAEALDSAKP
ncbi:3 exoribonuclease family protein [Grosmannia clavigera kw1407]|uniref:Ribosomal RNA-processing protein 43 n=1 Tax=Grosmannia clavigera (strain kw1407 / UAMH 11150) TaxID=655863 RepID=F0XT97_GROCL|nr:3 exoribonuclease family protein [Grosmannia clavigera kw1407]EFW99137.1 3 exoribonuclease family protein [Grosmannia clavigera kw1407]